MREDFTTTGPADGREEDVTSEGGAFDFYEMYREEMASIPPCTGEEEELLLKALAAGDESAKERLAEGNLALAVKVAGEYADTELAVGDRIQEANMALLLYLKEVRDGLGGTDGFHRELERRMRQAIEDALEEQKKEAEIGEEMAARVNVLKDISAGMAKELGREATVEELARRMKMTVDEIKDIMKLTLDAMSVGGGLMGEIPDGEFPDGETEDGEELR